MTFRVVPCDTKEVVSNTLGGGGGRLQLFLPGRVSIGLENRPSLKGLNVDDSDPN